jgi:sporulation protein YlmC with PRC-barrel domain
MMSGGGGGGGIWAMRLELGSAVRCSDAPFGELADVVVDPVRRRVTHLVVQPHRRPDGARLVPIERARDDGREIVLDCTAAEIAGLPPVHESAYLRLGETPVTDPAWEVGVQDVLMMPRDQELAGLGATYDPDPRMVVNYDRVPRHTVEIRRASAVTSCDGEHVGHVDGVLVSSDGTADIVLERGHLWRKREIVIPAAAIAGVEDDAVRLTLTKEQVGALAARRTHRWF